MHITVDNIVGEFRRLEDLVRFWKDQYNKKSDKYAILQAEVHRLKRYNDKLAEGLPNGMLPKDVENLMEANTRMASDILTLAGEIQNLEGKLKFGRPWRK